jgi:hypothetical protein
MNSNLIYIGIVAFVTGIILISYGKKINNEPFNPIPAKSSYYDARYAKTKESDFPPSCANTIKLMKYANNDNDIVQILQDGTYFGDSLKCYQDVRKAKKMNQSDFYNYCMAGKTGLPKADTLCSTPPSFCPSICGDITF